MSFIKLYISNKNIFIIVILLLLTLPTYVFLLKPGIYWNMHDDTQMIRQLEFEKCFKDGQIPCRWTQDLAYGYGLPLFNYYPPLPYIIGQFFRLFNLSFVNTIKITALLQIVFSTLFMYILAKSLFGDFGGIISSIFYTYAPYHALNIYVRGAMNEAWASVFFPLIFYFSKNLINTESLKNFILFSFSISLLLLSHNPMVLTFMPITIVWIIFWLYQKRFNKKNRVKQTVTKLLLSALLAVGLSAFFTFPSIIEMNLIQIDKMFSGYYSFYNHFASLYQLFISNYWGDGASIWGPNDGMSFSVGYLHWTIPLLITIYITVKTIHKNKIDVLDKMILLIIIISGALLFLTHERSTFIWKIILPLQKVQFPWRLINIFIFLSSLSIGYIPIILKKNIHKFYNYTIIFLIALVIILNFKKFYPLHYGPLTDYQKFSGLAWSNQISSGIYDYLPLNSSTNISTPSNDYIDKVIPEHNKYYLSGQKKGSDWKFFNIKIENRSTIFLTALAYPNFKLFVDGNNIKYQKDPLFGRITFEISPGDHTIYLKLFNTTIRTVSNIVSLFSYFIVLFLIFAKYEKNRRRTDKI